MTRRHELRCFDYVNHPYGQVKRALSDNALSIFERATRSTANRAHEDGAELRVRIGAVEIAADIAIEVTAIARARSPANQPATRIDLIWKSKRSPGLFPAMTGSLWAYALSPRETQLELTGSYDPPLGLLGDAIDAIALHRIAEESVRRFITDLASYLRAELPAEPVPGMMYPMAAS
jgi:hypothetical protein